MSALQNYVVYTWSSNELWTFEIKKNSQDSNNLNLNEENVGQFGLSSTYEQLVCRLVELHSLKYWISLIMMVFFRHRFYSIWPFTFFNWRQIRYSIEYIDHPIGCWSLPHRNTENISSTHQISFIKIQRRQSASEGDNATASEIFTPYKFG